MLTLRWSNAVIVWCTFVVALAIRLAVVAKSPAVNYGNTDLEIYQTDGALVRLHVNPYDPRDHVDVRARLRAETKSLTFKFTQAYWDFSVAGNLPFNVLFFGAIDAVSHDPRWYRFVFAVSDSLFAGLAMSFVLRYWPGASRWEAIISGAALGALSLVMLQWGVHSPQDKGVELLLMTGALLLTRSDRRIARLLLAPIVLGLSVAFKILGVFLLPLCLYWTWRRADASRSDLALFLALFGAAAAVWTIPYAADVLRIMQIKIGENAIAPDHASPLVWLVNKENTALTISRAWLARVVITAAVLLLGGIGLIRRTVSAELATAAGLMLVVCVLLIGGSMDRLNIAIVTAILLIGMQHAVARRAAVAIYVGLGFISAGLGYRLSLSEERTEALVVGLGVALLVGLLARRAFSGGQAAEHATAGRGSAPRAPASWRVAALAGTIVCALAVAQIAALQRGKTHPTDASAVSWPVNPFIGGWGLVFDESTYVRPPRVLLASLICEEYDGALIVSWDVLSRGGPFERRQYAVALDGKEHFISSEGLPYRSLTMTRISEYIVDFAVRDTVGGPIRATGTILGSTYNKSFVVTLNDARDPTVSLGRFVFGKY